MIVAFGSFVHGSGRSTVAREAAKRLGLPHISSGDVFREMVEERGMDIEEFASHLLPHPREMVKIEMEVDKHTARLIREYGDAVVDSNLHSLPEALEDVPHTIFFLYVSPHVIGERLLRKRRGERAYKAPEEAVESQLRRGWADVHRYALLERAAEGWLKRLYRAGVRRLSRDLRLYTLFARGVLTKQEFARLAALYTAGWAHAVDNDGPLEETVERVLSRLPLSP